MTGPAGADVRALALPLHDPAGFDPLLERIGSARTVLLGEASHGTHEYYWWRAALTRRLIRERGFSFVAVEGDWPDCARVHRSVTGEPDAPADPRVALDAFERWPTWMWANHEVVEFCRWLRAENARREASRRVGFHGLDVYSLWESLRAVLLHLREHDPAHVEPALTAFRCFEPYREDPQVYAWASRLVPEQCERAVVDLLAGLRRRAAGDGAGTFSVRQNAEVVAGAERYYRAMVRGGPDSWNVRDVHMTDTIDRLLEHHGPDAKAVVWEHNTHVGDARATDMAAARMVNVGQLVRERHGRDDVVIVGFGSHRGTVVAGSAWNAPGRVVPVPPARQGSLEALLHEAAPERALFVFPPGDRPRWLTGPLDHRAIGVVYDPARERRGNYVPTVLGERYDAFVWFDETRALAPLHAEPRHTREPETFPSGV